MAQRATWTGILFIFVQSLLLSRSPCWRLFWTEVDCRGREGEVDLLTPSFTTTDQYKICITAEILWKSSSCFLEHLSIRIINKAVTKGGQGQGHSAETPSPKEWTPKYGRSRTVSAVQCSQEGSGLYIGETKQPLHKDGPAQYFTLLGVVQTCSRLESIQPSAVTLGEGIRLLTARLTGSKARGENPNDTTHKQSNTFKKYSN